MTTNEKTKLILVIEKELVERVDDFRFENRIPTRAEAVRRLLRDGLKYNSRPDIDKTNQKQ